MKTGTQIMKHTGGSAAIIETPEMSLERIKDQVFLIQQVMQDVMIKDTHYGIIPGTKKPTLYKAGAEKLALTFHFCPDYEIIDKVQTDTFITYTAKCTLINQATGEDIATGIGSCNSRESKYRYRKVITDRPVPPAYWTNRDQKEIGGKGFGVEKSDDDGKWYITEKGENDNPWDLDNTYVKMACKRSFLAATLNGTAASDIFDQDLDDMPPGTFQTTKTQNEPPKKTQEPTQATQSHTPPSQGVTQGVEDEEVGTGWDKPTTAYSKMLHGLTSHKELVRIAKQLFDVQSWTELGKAQMVDVKASYDELTK